MLRRQKKKYIKVVEINPVLYFLIKNGDFIVYILYKFIIKTNTLQTTHAKYFCFEHKYIITSKLVKRKWKRIRKEERKEGKKEGKEGTKDQTL